MSSHEVLLRAFFDSPNLPLGRTLEIVLSLLRRHGLDPEYYTITSGHGSRSVRRPLRKKYSYAEIVHEVTLDRFEADGAGPGFIIQASRGGKERQISIMPPFPRCPFQSFGVSGLDVSKSHELIQAVSSLGRLAFSGTNNGDYLVWQRCYEPEVYERKYGLNPGFRLIQLERSPPLPPLIQMDISKNPGRISSVDKMPVFVSADMWLGPAFWNYAPCRKEEVLKEPWLTMEDTERYLYVKGYSEPFTRPDGEQGRIQRRLWSILFHQDCEWPPGSGGIANEAIPDAPYPSSPP